MIKNFLTTTLRHLWRNKLFTGLNMLGLSIGISSALVISLIVYYEFSFDTFQQDNDRIYRIVLDANFNGVEGHSVGVPAPLGGTIQQALTGIEQTVPVFQFPGDANIRVEGNNNASKPRLFKKQRHIVFTNNDYFNLLGYGWINGKPAETIENPFTVVLTESRARLYFPDLQPAEVVGKRLDYNDITLTVAGIVRDLDKPTDFRGKEFISLATIRATPLKDNFMLDVWNDWMANTQLFIKLSDGYSASAIQTQLNTFYQSHNTQNGREITLRLQPLNDVHFNAHYPTNGGFTAQRSTLYGLMSVAAFLLLLGCINFINLTTAQASQRAKEIGIRKTMGSSKLQLITQFMGETLLITSIATVLSALLIPIILQLFSAYIPEGLTAAFVFQPGYLLLLFLLVLLVSFLSGCYPALVLSGYAPVSVLKNQLAGMHSQTRHAGIRKVLTVSQFTIAQFFIIATIIVSKQISYSIDSEMGFDKEAVFKFDTPRDTTETRRTQLLHAIQAVPGVALASTGFLAPADRGMSFTNISYHNGHEELKPQTQIRWGDEHYLSVYRIQLLAGRNVLPGDSTKELLVNEQFAREIGFQQPQEALGAFITWNGRAVPIVGIMKDFHHQSTRSSISPLVFEKNNGSTVHIRLKPNRDGLSWSEAIANIQKAYQQVYPDEDFNYQFVDEMIAQFYEREQATAGLLAWAMSLSIGISCLGLLGLAIFTIHTRTKEIGIRKVLGASVAGIVGLLSKDFVKLVLLAVVIASPIAWWAMNRWLDDFAYRIDIQWWMFAVAGLAAVVIALLTVSWQAIRAAVANPVDSLRDE